jgi:hypothetical protein
VAEPSENQKRYPAPSTNNPPSRFRACEPRHAVDTSAIVHLINLAADVQGHIRDVSLGGCHIMVERRFPVGIFRRVEVEFRMEGLPFRLAGVTQTLYDPFNVGIRFLDISDRKREQLLQLIEEIKKDEETTVTRASENG